MKSFFKLVEIQTKVASVLPFLFGILYAAYRWQVFNFFNTLVFFLSLVTVDMGVTTLNNYMDYKRARNRAGYNYQEHNAIVRDQLSEGYVLRVLFGLFALSSGFGLYLVVLTDLWVLTVGVVAFTIGILYSYGPLPISRTPLGEVFSGFTMGFFIFFVAAYIQLTSPTLFAIQLVQGRLIFDIAIIQLLEMLYWSMPFILGIAGIMLANNISDIEDDTINGRTTLPISVGQKCSVRIFIMLYVVSFLLVLGLFVFAALPVYAAIVMIAFVPIFGLVKGFAKAPNKATTFINAVKAYMLLAVSLIVAVGIALIFR